jgi:hypothetical protein
MPKRFSRLKYALRALQNPLESSSNTPPAGSVLDNYNKVVTGQTKPTYTREAASKPGSLLTRAVNPFGIDSANAPALIKVSNRSFANSSISATRTACSILADNATGAMRYLRFRPAQVVIFLISASQTETLSTSKITGVKYNPREGSSFVLPFGKGVAGDSYSDKRGAILAAAPDTQGLSFKPEYAPNI